MTKQKKRLAIICAKGLANFLDWVDLVSDDYETRVFECVKDTDVQRAVEWGDILWLEWLNEVATYAASYLGLTPSGRDTAKKVIVRLHSYEVFADYPRNMQWHHVDKLVFVAEHVRDIFRERFVFGDLMKTYIPESDPSNATRSIVIENGVDVDKIEASTDKHGDIAVVGSINYKKEPALVLQIADALKSYSIMMGDKFECPRIHWAGGFQDPRFEVYMKHMIREMQLDDVVELYGHVNDMSKFWHGKKTLLHTSLHEGHSYAIMEAMARDMNLCIHNYRGAKDQYPRHWLFNPIDQAVEMLVSANVYHNSRNELLSRGWTTQIQAQKINKLLASLK